MLDWWTPEITQAFLVSLGAMLVPAIPVIGTIIVALINRGVRKSANGAGQEVATPTENMGVERFNTSLLRHIAGQDKKLNELQSYLTKATQENVRARNIVQDFRAKNAQLESIVSTQESRIVLLEAAVKELTVNAEKTND